MKLIPVNKDVELIQEIGFDGVLEYNNECFRGHQKGVVICLINKETGVVEENHLKSESEEVLKKILESKEIIKIVEDITQLDEDAGKLVPKQLFYLPYIVSGHSAYKPTINYRNISGAINVDYTLEIEVLLVHNGLSRYITLKVYTTNTSIMDSVRLAFDGLNDDVEEFKENGFFYQKEEDEEGNIGLCVDFYDEAGNRYNQYYSGMYPGDQLWDDIVSVRLIGFKEEIKELKDEEA